MHVRSEALHTNRTSRGNLICGGDTKTPASSTHGTRSKSSTANPTTPTKTRTQNQELQLGKQEFHSLSFANAWRPTRSQIIHRRCLHLRTANSKSNGLGYPHTKESRHLTIRNFETSQRRLHGNSKTKSKQNSVRTSRCSKPVGDESNDPKCTTAFRPVPDKNSGTITNKEFFLE